MKPFRLLSLVTWPLALVTFAAAAYFPYNPSTKDFQDNAKIPAGKTLYIRGTLDATGANVIGLNGGSGNTMLFGIGVPSGGTGAVGDTYYRTDTPYGLYKKTGASAWTLQLTLWDAVKIAADDAIVLAAASSDATTKANAAQAAAIASAASDAITKANSAQAAAISAAATDATTKANAAQAAAISAAATDATTKANAKVADAIADNVTAVAPSQNAVFDALALKAPVGSATASVTNALSLTNPGGPWPIITQTFSGTPVTWTYTGGSDTAGEGQIRQVTCTSPTVLTITPTSSSFYRNGSTSALASTITVPIGVHTFRIWTPNAGSTLYLDDTVVTAADVPVAATPTNYTAASQNVESHLTGIDTKLGTLVAGGNGTAFSSTVTQAAHGFVAGDVVNNNAGTYAKARANSFSTIAQPYWVESATTNTFVAVPSGRVNITGLGYTAGTYRYLSSATAGATSTTAPAANGTFTAPVLYVESTTVGYVNPAQALTNDNGISVKTANYTATPADSVIVCNSASAFTITLYNANTAGGSPLTITNKNTGTVTVDATSLGQINGVNTISIFGNASVTLTPDGTTWSRSLSAYSSSYTTAQLLALSAADSAAQRTAFCSDCLTPQGTGAMVYYDGSKWRSTATNIEATTNMLTFFRGYCADYGVSAALLNTVGYIEDGIFPGQISAYSAQNGGLFNSSAIATVASRPFWSLHQLATNANSGVRNSGNMFFSSSRTSHGYHRVIYSLSNLSTTVEEYSLHVGFSAAVGYSLSTSFAGFAYDRGNALGGLNAGNNDKWLCVTRNASTNTVTVTSITPSISTTAPDLLEVFYTASSVEFYINGALVATHTTNIPTGTLARNMVTLKSAGTSTRNIYFTDTGLVFRTQ